VNRFTLSTIPGPPLSIDEASRTAELVIATSAPIGGVSLDCSAGAVNYGPAPVPVLLDHENQTGAMAGRILSIRSEANQLIGVAQFSDAPAADAGWALAQAGCAVSVGALVQPADLVPLDATADRAARWTLREASLVPVGADPACVVRSAEPLSPSPMNTQTATDSAPEIISRAEITRERNILRSAQAANLNTAETQELIDSGKPFDAVVVTILERMAARTPAKTTGAMVALPNNDHTAEGLIQRALEGKLTGDPLWLQLRQFGYGGNAKNGPDLITRAMSTSDLPNLLQASGDRQLAARFLEQQGGVLAAARNRPLNDYRTASTVDLALVGTATKMIEGAEVELGYVTDSGISYKPTRWSRGLKVSHEAMANDDLAGMAEAISELASACLDAEKSELAYLLQGTANGATVSDGTAMFATAHGNNAAGGLTIAGLSAAIAALRGQTTAGGRFIDLQPGTLIVPIAAETTALQLISTNLAAAVTANVQPWTNIKVEVEPRLSGSYCYLVAAGARLPLELGRLTAAPGLLTETEFKTGAYMAKASHSFGVAATEYRAIVRLALS